jgi:hypothetical protein
LFRQQQQALHTLPRQNNQWWKDSAIYIMAVGPESLVFGQGLPWEKNYAEKLFLQ